MSITGSSSGDIDGLCLSFVLLSLPAGLSAQKLRTDLPTTTSEDHDGQQHQGPDRQEVEGQRPESRLAALADIPWRGYPSGRQSSQSRGGRPLLRESQIRLKRAHRSLTQPPAQAIPSVVASLGRSRSSSEILRRS